MVNSLTFRARIKLGYFTLFARVEEVSSKEFGELGSETSDFTYFIQIMIKYSVTSSTD